MGCLRFFVSLSWCFLLISKVASQTARCNDPYFGSCYGVSHKCPPGCPALCEVDCKICKPYCACDKPGAVCQDPRFVGGDGIMFYFHGRKGRDFCLLSDSSIHVNGHFIGKSSHRGRDFTWVQSIGVLFGSHQLYVGARKVATWDDSLDSMVLKLDGEDIVIPAGDSQSWEVVGLKIRRRGDQNAVVVEVAGRLTVSARVVPITTEESRVHGYDISSEDCFAHLELNFRLESATQRVNGVLGQTYSPSYLSRVKVGVAMPVMGGADRFASSHVFATDCAVSNFEGLEMGEGKRREFVSVDCRSGSGGGKGIMCRK